MESIRKYLSLIKFSHTIFAMPFALIGFFLAVKKMRLEENFTFSFSDHQFLYKFTGVIVCMVFARSAAMAFNRYLDQKIDALNPRTAVREIPSGKIKASNALIFTIICVIVFVISAWFINALCFWLSFPALFIILFYSYTKRFTALCHLVLGLGLSLAPIGAYLALLEKFDLLPLLFSFTVLFWVSGFDVIYSMQDESFDKSNKLHSIPAAVGIKNALLISKLLHIITSFLLIYAGLYGSFGFFYWIGAALFLSMLVYQQSIVKVNDLSKVNLAFMTANGVASVVFSFFVILDIFI
ncbi:MAG: 4-hydroxybenzoate octaprenyltransferase [Ferruginibacter sp.]|nr:4-hydroxybenzoate octaprenyltransferase [Ferruginibacter sp.]